MKTNLIKRTRLLGTITIISFCMIMCFAMSAFAEPSSQIYPDIDISELTYISLDVHSQHEGEIVPAGITACPFGNGICNAMTRGWAVVYYPNPTTRAFVGACWQCTRCYTVYATEFDPVADGIVGRWISRAYPEPVSGTGVIIDAPHLNYTSSNTIPGVAFRLLK